MERGQKVRSKSEFKESVPRVSSRSDINERDQKVRSMSEFKE